MNKRMKEPFHTIMWKASIGYNDSWSQVDPEVLEKFAELIVRECMKVSRGADGLDATHEAWYLIKKHFGVK